MSLYRLTLAYDGTDFEGWQIQARAGARTVQGALERALLTLSGGTLVRANAASRTDAGVHALGQVVSFELGRAWKPEQLLRALNGLLPADVRALDVAEALPGFHARRSALGKHYRYTLDTGPVQSPLRRRYAAHVPGPLAAASLEQAAALFLGRHDFTSLQSAGGSVKTTERTVTRSLARLETGTLTFDVLADGFLRKMVRNMVGGLVAVGSGAWSVEALRQALLARDRRAWPKPVQARGLLLVRVVYPAESAGVR